MSDAEKLARVEDAIRDYHFALDSRKHAGIAQAVAFDAIEEAIGLRWLPGAEAERRSTNPPRTSDTASRP